jgi:hypothetical protein
MDISYRLKPNIGEYKNVTIIHMPSCKVSNLNKTAKVYQDGFQHLVAIPKPDIKS